MAFYDIARSGSAYDSYVVLRGSFQSGATGVWATRSVKTTTGILDGRLDLGGNIHTSLPETIGGPPERVSVSVTLQNHDHSLTPYIRGTASEAATTEGRGDSWLNYTGKLYFGVRDASTGTLYEQAITPTLCLAGSISYDGFTLTLPLASQDDLILGDSQIAFTVRDLKNSAAGASDGTWYGRYDSDALTQTTFTSILNAFTDNLDETVPYLYGKNVVRLIKVGHTITSDKASVGTHTYVGWASIKEPDITGFEYSDSGTGVQRWPFYIGNRGEQAQEVASGQRPAPGDVYSVMLDTIQRSITNARGQTFSAWVVVAKLAIGTDEQGRKTADAPIYLDVGMVQGVEDPAVPWRDTYGYAAGVIRALVRDHSSAGATAINETSFQRPNGGVGIGLLYTPSNTVASALEKLAAASGSLLWVETDDKLNIANMGSFTSDDLATAAAGLTHITHADIVDGWKETLPFDDGNQRGAPARRVLIRWSGDQEKFWGNDGKSRHLATEAPGVLSILPSLAGAIDAEIPGDAIYPPRALSLLAEAVTRRGIPRRRIECVCRAWLGTMALGSLFYLSHPRGLGSSSSGYSLRLVRLESKDLTWREDGCRCVFEDLGPAADMRVGVLGTIANWTKATPTAGWTLTLTSGSAVVTSSNAIFSAGMATAGAECHLWTPGAANSGNRSSKKIVGFTSATQVTVESNYTANEVITAAGSGWTATWIVMETQASKGTSYLSDRIRNCVESTGLYRDGATAGFQYTIT